MKEYYIVAEKKAKALQEIDLTQRSTEDCKKFHKSILQAMDYDEGFEFFSQGIICAGGQKNRDGCKGDSGSALMVKDRTNRSVVQVGLMSGGGADECGTEGAPSYYTRVTYYLKWILDNIYE